MPVRAQKVARFSRSTWLCWGARPAAKAAREFGRDAVDELGSRQMLVLAASADDDRNQPRLVTHPAVERPLRNAVLQADHGKGQAGFWRILQVDRGNRFVAESGQLVSQRVQGRMSTQQAPADDVGRGEDQLSAGHGAASDMDRLYATHINRQVGDPLAQFDMCTLAFQELGTGSWQQSAEFSAGDKQV